MVQLLRPFQLIRESLTTTCVGGEVTVHLNINLTLTLDQDGTLKVAASAKEDKKGGELIVPDFSGCDNDLLKNFGEEVK